MIVDTYRLLPFIPSRHNKTLTKKEKKMMTDYSDYIQDVVRNKKVGFLFNHQVHVSKCERIDSRALFIPQAKLYDWYLQQCAAEYDL